MTTYDLPSYNELRKALPVPFIQAQKIDRFRKLCSQTLLDHSLEPLFIIGPCSIHDYNETLLYAERLKSLNYERIIMRVFYEKPRTVNGWKGFLHDPQLNGSYDLKSGLFLTRKLLLEITKIGLPIASELLTPQLVPYFEDLITFGCIGARTTVSQPHRILGSDMPFPVGFKNSLSGCIKSAVQSSFVASQSHAHVTLEHNRLVAKKTKGNPCTPVILRGGSHHTNYSKENIKEAAQAQLAFNNTSSVIVDCSHDNSKKNSFKQIDIFNEVLNNSPKSLRGIMLESYLKSGSQPLTNEALRFGVSITDSCLSFDETQELLENALLCSTF